MKEPNLKMDDDDFLQDLIASYSEIETLPESETEHIRPKTIDEYYKRIHKNNTASVFDVNYDLEISNSNISSEESSIFDDYERNVPGSINSGISDRRIKSKDKKPIVKKSPFDDNDTNITYVVMGRGRGGRNQYIRPGEDRTSKVENDDEVIKQLLRKVAPYGFSNDITEEAIRAHHQAQCFENEEIAKKDTENVNRASSVNNVPSPIKFKSMTNTYSNKSSISGKSTPSSIKSSDINSSVYLTPKHDSSPEIKEFDEKDKENGNEVLYREFEDAEEYVQTRDNKENQGAIPKIVQAQAIQAPEQKKPVALSVLRRKAREEYEEKKQKVNDNIDSNRKKEIENIITMDDQKYLDEIATKQMIAELLKQDRKAIENKRNTSDTSSNSSSSTRDDWRRSSYSPPRFAWGSGFMRSKQKPLDIQSLSDFPVLK